MAFDPDQFLAQTSTAPTAGAFDPNQFLAETEPKSLAGFGRNLVSDVKGTANALFGEGGLGNQLMDNPVKTGYNLVKGLPGAIVEEGKRIGVGELLTGHPINAIEKFGEAAYNKPLTTGLDVLPVAGAAGKALGFGGKAAKGAELALQGAEVADVASDVGRIGELQAIPKGTIGKSATREAAEAAGAAENVIPMERVVGNTVTKGTPPGRTFTPGLAPEEAESAISGLTKKGTDALKEVNDYITGKYGQAAKKPGFIERTGNYLKNEAADLRGKDIGLMPAQIKSMGPGFEGLEKAEALMDYAGQKGYFKPGLTDVERKALIKSTLDKTGQSVGAIRKISDLRGAPPVADMVQEVKKALTRDYGVDAPAEIQKVLKKIKAQAKTDPTFTGMSDLSTDLNKSKTTAMKMGQHPGPTTDAANIISRMNNDAIRGVLNPQESALYTDSLRDFGAHKKLEQMVASAGRKSMAGRGGAVGDIFNRMWQGFLDRGGYRMAGNIANRMGTSMVKNPSKFGSIPEFFEELAHHSGDVLDETLDIGGQGMAYGGVVGEDPMAAPMAQAAPEQMQPGGVTQSDTQASIVAHYVRMQRDPEYNLAFTQSKEH